MIIDLLTNKTAAQKADLKATELAKVNVSGQFSIGDITVEVQSIAKVDKGIEIFARAWEKGQPLGFGDGSVEIERFRIFNPPILVDDPNGTIERIRYDGSIRTLKEDPITAIQQTLAHTIKVSAKRGTNVISGKVGNTTDTFFPDPSPESTSVDGVVTYDDDATWATVHDAADGNHAEDSTADVGFYVLNSGGLYRIRRFFTLFDTASIPDTDTITSATYSVASTGVLGDGDDDGNDYLNVYATTPASNTALTTADYDQIGTTAQATAIDLGVIPHTDTNYADWTLNATGLGNISKTGVTKFGLRFGHDVVNDPIASGQSDRWDIYMADTAGTTVDPKLVVVHSAAAASTGMSHLNLLGVS